MTASIFFADGFDDYTDISQKWNSSSTGGTFGIVSTNARTGSRCCEQNASNGNGRLLLSYANRAQVIVGFAVKYTTFPGSESELFAYYDATAGNNQVQLNIDGAGNITVRRGGSNTSLGTLLGTASSQMPFNAYHYLEFGVTINSSSGTIDVWLDGTNVLHLTGQNTQNTANAFTNQIWFGAGGSPIYFFDDFYLLDPTVGAYSTHLGDVDMEVELPSANGSTNNFTNVFGSWPTSTAVPVGYTIQDSNGNIQRVQSISGSGTTGGSHPTWATTGGSTTTDNPGGNQVVWVCLGTGSNPPPANWMAVSDNPPDDNSSYITDATPGDIQRFTYPPIAGSAVKAVVVGFRGEKDDAGTRTMRVVTKSGSATADNGADFVLALNTYADYQGTFETDPNTGVAWTVAGVNAAEFGVKTTT